MLIKKFIIYLIPLIVGFFLGAQFLKQEIWPFGRGYYHSFTMIKKYGLDYKDIITEEQKDRNLRRFYLDLELKAKDSLNLSLTVYNSGDIDGQEVVQVYVSDLYASITPDNKRLRAFDKIYIKSGESKKVSFSIPVNDFSFVNNENKSVLESGDFTVHVGGNSKDLSSLNFFVR